MSPKPKNQPTIAIIGGGLSGLTLALELKKNLGLEKTVTIYEKHPHDVGGTWRDNYYPGCACDVPSHWYSLSTELNPDWTSKYSGQAEIQKYWQGIYKKHNLAKQTKFDSTFIKGEWDAVAQGYNVEFKRKDGSTFSIKCDVLISCIGGFSTPLDKPHGMKGIDSFKGPVFHSARWRKDVDLKGKRVAVIGNGCSAAQFIPILAEEKSTQVINFSRTPSWFAPRDQKDYSRVTKAAFRYVPGLMRSYRNFIAITSDSRFVVWWLQFSTLRHYVEEHMANYIRQNSPEKYHDFLVPKYPFGCKRVIMDPGYLQCLFRSNVELVTDGISTITEKGLLGKSGKEYEFDVLILATGFDVSEVGLGINIVGRNEKTVTEQWKEQNGPQAYLGTTIANYPNFYSVLGPNVASGTASVVYSTEAQVNYIVKMIEPMVKYGVKSFECKVEVEQQYNEYIQNRLKGTVWNGGCTSYYKLGEKVVATFPGPTSEFVWRTRKPKFENFTQTGGTVRVAARHAQKKIAKWFTLFALIALFRKFGYKRIRNEILLWLLMRYQKVIPIINRVRGRVE
ncbi:BZ3500_MvSof-1268-A1-R1_Chr8-1g09824 [Microbotryum saponariae]|uniref:BZ3500_MvSof-1268-A1-R1_Chr8-1g09824 protein n=1 Tax=Microbotryum saponariae TaxID=289078 RepID=A0A2X0KSC4_9BASI|nr:BZ3500_MvSof-1268-A1-R1_Chr8-1g09824 [Microbotryum saponariae]SDA08110.1 BZ3501_MvSof-1269-A2-R1_Chr8-1g09547 [Microbotryum saponariae]